VCFAATGVAVVLTALAAANGPVPAG